MNIDPRHYRNLKWSRTLHSKIDTVTMSPITNVLPEEATAIHTETFTTGTLNNESITFPIADTIVDTYYHKLWNVTRNKDYAKGYVGCVMARGSKDIILRQPIVGNVYAEITLIGRNSELDRGGGSYNAYPAYGTFSPSYNLASWIKNNATSSSEGLKWTYNKNDFGLNPFVRHFIPLDVTQLPTPNDICTTWRVNKATQNGTTLHGWREEGTQSPDLAVERMYTTDATGSTSDPLGSAFMIALKNDRIKIICNVAKINDHTLRIDWEAPVRVTYAAASRQSAIITGAWSEVDNWAIVDNITQVNVSIYGYNLSTDVVKKSYSISKGQLTEQVTNQYPFKIEAGEFLTLDTIVSGQLWTEAIPTILLNNYSKGKYVATLDVPADWAIRNNLHIRDRVHKIIGQDGVPIRRNGVDCKFYICNITKRFSGSEFIFTLSFVEK